MNEKQYYETGQLSQAIKVADEEVRRQPADTTKRGFLVELLCIAGNLERADKQLDIIAEQDSVMAVGVALLRQLVRAEQCRQQCFTEGRPPEFIGEPSGILRLHLEALTEWRLGDDQRAYELLQATTQYHSALRGKCTENAFNGMRDLDDLCASFLEVLTSNGKYYWIAFDQVSLLKLHAPQRPLDLLWRRASLEVNGGPQGEVYIPVIYATSELDDAARLGRKTDWRKSKAGLVQGVGQRIFLMGDNATPLLEIDSLSIDKLAATATIV